MGQAQDSDTTPQLRADARRNRDRLLQAARDAFAEAGAAAPLELVAQRAGVGVGTLYRHFPDRQALQRAVALDILRRLAGILDDTRAEASDACTALATYMHRALALRIGAVMPALAAQLPAEDPELHEARAAVTAPVQALITAAQAEGTLRADVAFGDISLLIIRLARPLPASIPPELNEQVAHRQLDLLFAGLRAVPQADSALSGPALSLEDLRRLGGA